MRCMRWQNIFVMAATARMVKASLSSMVSKTRSLQ